jgi:hypothetical protein
LLVVAAEKGDNYGASQPNMSETKPSASGCTFLRGL